MAKKKPKREPVMEFYNLRLNQQDLEHLRFVLEGEVAMQQDMMDNPATGLSADEALEHWVISRDMKCFALRIIQMIDKVHPPRRKR